MGLRKSNERGLASNGGKRRACPEASTAAREQSENGNLVALVQGKLPGSLRTSVKGQANELLWG